MKNILAVDIGGTKSAIGLCYIQNGQVLKVEGNTELPSRQYHSLENMIQIWHSQFPTLSFDAIGAGVAGPVVERKCHLTNLGWSIDADTIQSRWGVPVLLCNDMASHGWGIIGLHTSNLVTLNKGEKSPGAMALIAAGTGLGESVIGWNGINHSPMPGEGGHSSFSPTNEFEDGLLKYLRAELNGHVSWERVLGGYDGFRNLTKYFSIYSKQTIPTEFNLNFDQNDDWGKSIISKGHEGHKFAVQILELYAELYGKEAANLALKCVPSSGVFIGGGIAMRILPWMKSHFMKGFIAKGRFTDLLKSLPVYIVNDPLNGLKGAALQFLGEVRR